MGRWEGTTSQQLAFRFLVEGTPAVPGVAVIEYGWELPGCRWQNSLTFTELAPIFGDRMTVRMDTGGSITDIDLKFEGADAAQGTIAFSVSDLPEAPGCVGQGEATITAQRKP